MPHGLKSNLLFMKTYLSAHISLSLVKKFENNYLFCLIGGHIKEFQLCMEIIICHNIKNADF